MVSQAPRERLADLLTTVAPPSPPCVQLNARAGALRLEVEGIGRIPLPVPAEVAAQLVALAAPARFGRGEQTLTDPEVRDTWEVPRDLVRARWSTALTKALATVHEYFRLPEQARLVADLHSLLVYRPGQFFLPHQDSEKHDTMIGTLVVTLPSPYTGGELIIHHGQESRTHRGWESDLALVAFHADRRHEVRPVTSGHRVTLTYNLLVEARAGTDGGGNGPAVADADDELLAGHLTEHFATPVVHRYRTEQGPPPSRLVYLLDHEYSERGLDWSRLKGSDIARAAGLRTAAAAAGCECALALTEIQETWDAYEPDRYHRRRYRYHRDEEPDPEPDADEYEVNGLIDSSIHLTHWVDESGRRRAISLRVTDDEVCASTPSAALDPYSTQYEGYMGNWGNTLDRWYRRAAVVVWPRELAFATRAEATPSWALEELLRRATGGDLDAARADAATLAPFWDRVTLPQDDGATFGTALRAAGALDDAETALLLVRRFRIEELQARHVAPLAALAGRYGRAWTAGLLQIWFGRRTAWVPDLPDRRTWVCSLTTLCEQLLASSAGVTGEVPGGESDSATGGRVVAALLVDSGSDWLRGSLEAALAASRPSARASALAELGDPLAAVATAISMVGRAGPRKALVAFGRRHSGDLTGCVLRALRAASRLDGEERHRSGLDALAAQCAQALRDRTARPERADGDSSITLPAGCTCELCQNLDAFLRDSERTTLEWPLAQARRQHVHARIDAAELPVGHVTQRTGRPYTLVLTKTSQLFAKERRARRRDEKDLAWLVRHWDVGAST